MASRAAERSTNSAPDPSRGSLASWSEGAHLATTERAAATIDRIARRVEDALDAAQSMDAEQAQSRN